jgi:hypothetical protein
MTLAGRNDCAVKCEFDCQTSGSSGPVGADSVNPECQMPLANRRGDGYARTAVMRKWVCHGSWRGFRGIQLEQGVAEDLI